MPETVEGRDKRLAIHTHNRCVGQVAWTRQALRFMYHLPTLSPKAQSIVYKMEELASELDWELKHNRQGP